MADHSQDSDKAAKAAKRLANIENRLDELQRAVARIEELVNNDSRKMSTVIDLVSKNIAATHSIAAVAHHPVSERAPNNSVLETPRFGQMSTFGPMLSSFEPLSNKTQSSVDDDRRLRLRNFNPLSATDDADQILGGRSPGTASNVSAMRERFSEKNPTAAPNSQSNPGIMPKKGIKSFRELVGAKMKALKGEPKEEDTLALAPSMAFPTSEISAPTIAATSGDNTIPAQSPKLEDSAEPGSLTKSTLTRTFGDGNRNDGSDSFDVDGPFVSLCDVLFIITAVFTCVFTITVWHPRSGYNFDEVPSGALVGWLIFVYIFGAGWVGLRFHIRNRIGDWEVVDDLPTIRATYLKSWFAYDIIYAVPIDLVFLGWANRVFYFLMLRHFLRYFRMLNLGKSVNPLMATRMWFTFIAYLGTMVLAAHTIGNVFWAVQSENNDQLTYIQSLYWAVASMTSVGYGDLVATTDNGRAFACFAMFLGVCMIATFSAFATAYVLDKDAIEVELANRKAMIHSMLKYYDIPWSMQREVIQVMPAALQKSTEAQFRQELELLPHFIQPKVALYFNAHQLRQIPLFAEANQELVLDMSKKMRKHFVPRYEMIFHQMDPAIEMFFVLHGAVELIVVGDENDFEVVQQVREGRWFGEEIFKSEGGALRSVNAQAITNCDLIALDKEALSEIIALDTKVKESILVAYRARKVNTAKALRSIRRRRGASDQRRKSVVLLGASIEEQPNTSAKDPLSPATATESSDDEAAGDLQM